MKKVFLFSRCFTLLSVAQMASTLLLGQSTPTTIKVNNTLLQGPVKRLGINLGSQTSYDSGQMVKNLLFTNGGFEGEIFQSVIRCVSGSTTVCNDDNWFSGWPNNFFTGATFEFFYGAAQGRTGTITSFTGATGLAGAIFGLSGTGAIPGTGDYMIVRQTIPGNATAGWSSYLTAAGTITTNSTDLPVGTAGKQTVAVTAPSVGDRAVLTAYIDGTPGITFLQFNGTYQLSFKAKGTSGAKAVAVSLTRYGAGTIFLNQTVNLTSGWATYTLPFNAAETGSSVGTVQMSFSANGSDAFLLDDVNLAQINTDPTNATVFRDPVVNTLKSLNPGVLRFWDFQLGDTLDNMLSDPFGRQRTGYSAFRTVTDHITYSLTEFMQLCELIGAEPWVVVPATFSPTEAANLIDYLAGGTGTTYGAKRAAAGHPATWTSSFSKIHLEFGNEAWNPGFKGGSIEYSDPYGQRAQTIFGAMRATASYVTTAFDLVLGGQASSPGRNQGIQNSCNNNDTFAVAPYMMNTVDAFSTVEDLYGSTLAEAEAFQVTRGTAEGISNGLMIQNQLNLQASSHPTPLVSYEMAMSTLTGSITQTALNGYVSSLGAGLAVVDSMLQQMRQGVLTQNLYALPQYINNRSDGKSVYLWGAVIDMGVTDRRRPQFHAMQMANSAIANNAIMLQTVHTGADPTWNQPLVNTVQLTGAHYLQSFAFLGGGRYSIVVFNLHRTSTLPVNFGGANVPNGTVQIQQLTSSQISDTNEVSNLVAPVLSTASNFNSLATFSLPPYSITVLSWAAGSNAAPLISAVTASAINTTSATINWTTDQPSTTLVAYGPTTGYGYLSLINIALTTSHSVTLTGLTPGTTYNFAAISANSANVSSTSDNSTLVTLALPAPQISAVTSTGITPTSATIVWATDQAATTQVQYGTTGTYGSFSTANNSLVTSHSATLTNLTQNTIYYYQALSTNSAGTLSNSANFTFTTPITPAVISAITVTGLTSTSATVNWTTDQPATTQAEFGTTSAYGTFSAQNTTLTTSHSVTIINLPANTLYNFAVLSTNALGATSTSANSTFTTQQPAAVISALTVTGITASGATIAWTTDQLSTTQVQYGTTAAYGSSSTANPALVTAHSVTLTGLSTATLYNFAALSTNSLGIQGTSANLTFTTSTPAAVISALTATAISTSSATISWTTDQPTTTQVQYGTTTAYGGLSTASNNLVTSHSVVISGLTPGSTYNYEALSTNFSGTTTTSANATFTTAAQFAIISNVNATSITTNSAAISWTTDQPTTTQVQFGTTTAYGGFSTGNATLVTSHSVTITGLNPGTLYNVAALSTNSLGSTTTSANFTFTTLAQFTAISGVGTNGITNTTANIVWTTDQPASSQVAFGTTPAYGLLSTASPALVTSHVVSIAGLTAGTVYNFAALSTNSIGSTTTSANFTFTATPYAIPPVMSGVSVTGVTSNSATITWTTDQPTTSQVQFGTTTAYGSQSLINNTLVTAHTVTLTGLNPATNYNFQALSTDAQALSATSANMTFTTAAGPAITSVVATSISSNSAIITWTTDQPASSQVQYGTTIAYGSQSTLNSALLTTHSVTLTGLNPTTAYNYSVVSSNAAGSATTSANFMFSTTAVGAPVISAIAVSAISTTSATVTWTTDVVSTSQVSYGATTAYGSASLLNSSLSLTHSVTLTSLTPGTTYNFAAVSASGSGTSATSPNFTFGTTAAGPPPVISGVTVSGVTNTSATISWNTDVPSTTQVFYGLTTAYGSQSALDPTLVTAHTVTLTGLTFNATYNFDAVSNGSTGTPGTSPNFTFVATSQPAPVLTSVAAWPVNATSASILWTTDQNATSQVKFGTTAAYGVQTVLNGTLGLYHGVQLSGLTPGTTYHFSALSMGATGSLGSSPDFSFTTSGTAPLVISAVTASAITGSSATITWTTDVIASSQVSYGTTTAYGSQTTLNSALVTAHSVTLTGLGTGATYNYVVTSTSLAGGTATSLNFTFATPSTPPAVITAVTASGISSTSATITWTTDQTASTLVNYGTTTAYGSQSALNSTPVTAHSMTLAGLTPSTTYNYAVTSVNGSGTPTTSVNFTFATTAAPAPAITAVTASAISSTSATITWTTDQTASTLVNYGTTTAYGSQSTLNSTLLTAHTVTLTGLTASTTYNYAATSANGGGTSTTSVNFTFATTAAPAPVITAVTASGISSTSATITWTTDQTASTLVNYGTTTGYGSQSALNSTLVTAHTVTLTGLTVGTTYNYAVTSANGAGTSATSSNFTFATTAAPAPVITAVAASGISSTSATITWTTDQTASTLVNYGTTTAYGSQSTLNSTLVTAHTVTLTGLTPSTTFNYAVTSANGGGASTTSTNFTFATAAASPPVITAVTASGISSTSATITWTTDQTASTLVNYGTTTAYGSQSTLNSALVTSHTVTLTGLTASTNYNYAVTSTNGGGTPTSSVNFTFATTATPAPVITAVAASGINSTSATITWTTDQTASTLVNYGTTTAYGSQSTLNSTLVTAHTVTLTGLTASTTYNYAVTSSNGGGTSATSANFTFATTAAPAPVITAVAASGISLTTATITWTTDQTASTLVNYGTTTAYGSQSTLNSTLVTAHSVTLTGLTAGTTYNYAVTSANGAGTSATSVNFTFATTAAPAPIITAVTASGISATSATITWTTDQTATTLVNYGTTTAYGSQSTLNSTLVTAHTVTLAGLTAGTTYNYAVTSANGGGASTTSTNFTFATTAAPAPIITVVTASGINSTSATITWTTDQISSTQAKYGITTAYGTLSTLNSTLVTSHSVTLTGLTAGTSYNYAALSANSAGTLATSANFTFTTAAAVAGPNLSGLASWGASGTGVIIAWSTDQQSDTAVEYGTTTALGQTSPVDPTLTVSHGVTLTGLTGNTTYYYRGRSTNSGGGIGYTAISSFKTLDNTAPVISNVVATPGSGNKAVVSWSVSKPATTQVEYGFNLTYGWWSPATTGTSTPLGWVNSGTIHYRIHSMDSLGNQTVTQDFTFIEP